ncbi:hypothetical protein WG947_04465 [Pontibacter sp. H259]|uniref:hypothetical protein n=1 Tax=Pontibacter sp. H259 TaxID=3133421 RepID=UPI0030C04333
MKANKPLKEAILRAPETNNENTQPQQEQLLHLGTSSKDKTTTATARPGDLINESPRNRLASLQTLRELEQDIEKQQRKKK